MKGLRVIAVALLLAAAWAVRPTAATAKPLQNQEQEQDALAALGDFGDFDELDLGDLLNISVSIAAAGQIRSLEEAPGVVSVVTKEDIRRLGARTLEELLELLPGIEVLSDGLGVGRIFIRGIGASTSSQNVLVLFDGHRLNEEITGGATQLNLDIPVDNIEQLEVIRGPGSALFGANAFLGVINIVSQNADTFDGLEVTVGSGSHGTVQTNAQWADWFGELGVSAFVQYNDRSGPNLPVPADGQTLFDELVAPLGIAPVSLAPGTTFGARDGVTANLQAKFRSLTLNSRYKEEDSESYIGIVDTLRDTGFLRNRQFAIDLAYDWDLGDTVSMRTSALLTENQTDYRFDVLAPGFALPIDLGPSTIAIPVAPGVAIEQDTKTRRLGGEITADIRTADSNHLVVGAAYESEKPYEVNTLGTVRRVDPFFVGNTEVFFLPNNGLEPIDDSIPEQRRNITSAYAQDTWDASERVTVTVGLRWDDYSDFGSTLNPRLALVWRLPSDWNVKLSPRRSRSRWPLPGPRSAASRRSSRPCSGPALGAGRASR